MCHGTILELDRPTGRCATCQRLASAPDPGDDVLTAALGVLGERTSAKSWRSARDGSHQVIEADLGWTRKVVFCVPHGETRAERAMAHSMLGARRRELRY